MTIKKVMRWISGVGALVIIGSTLYKIVSGQETGSNEIIGIGTALTLFFSTIAWGTKGEDDGIREDEELGRRISERSGMLGYYILLAMLLLTIVGEEWLYGTHSPLLLILLAIGMFLHPMLEFLQTRKYR